MNIKDRLDKILPYNMVLVMLYYGCPLFINNETFAMILMLAVLPVGVFFTSFYLGLKVGLSLLYLALAAVSFLPSYWVFLNDWEALGFYLLMYLVIAVFGMLLGWGVSKIVRKMLER